MGVLAPMGVLAKVCAHAGASADGGPRSSVRAHMLGVRWGEKSFINEFIDFTFTTG